MSIRARCWCNSCVKSCGLTGTHVGCDTSQCGACVVHIDGKAVKSCTTLTVMADGADVPTIEGLAADGAPLHPMQEAFRRKSRPAMRLLHAGHDHDGRRYGAPQGQRSRRAYHSRGARRQSLPLHGLPEHRQVDRGRRQGDGNRRRSRALRCFRATRSFQGNDSKDFDNV